MHRTARKRVTVQATLVSTWQVLKVAASEAQEKADEAQAAVLAALADADAGDTDDGAGEVRVTKVSTDRIDSKRLRKEFPDIAATVTNTTESVRMTYKPKKETT